MARMWRGAAADRIEAESVPTSRWRCVRGLETAVIALVLPISLAALACQASPAATPSPTTPDLPSVSVAPTSGDTSLLKISGTGSKASEEFNASGESVDVKFSYDCPTENSFVLNFYGANVSPVLPDVIVDEFGTTRSDVSVENLNSTTGPFHVEITSECSWSVEVLGTP